MITSPNDDFRRGADDADREDLSGEPYGRPELPGAGAARPAPTGESSLGKRQVALPKSRTFTVDSVYLEALRRNEVALQLYLEWYLHSSDVLNRCGRVLQRLVAGRRPPGENEQDPTWWFDYWTDLGIALEEMQTSAERLSDWDPSSELAARFGTTVSDRLDRFLADLERALEWVGEIKNDVEGFDSFAEADRLAEHLDQMEDAIRGLNDECRKAAKDQLKKLNSVVGQIFSRIEALKEVRREESKASASGHDPRLAPGAPVRSEPVATRSVPRDLPAATEALPQSDAVVAKSPSRPDPEKAALRKAVFGSVPVGR